MTLNHKLNKWKNLKRLCFFGAYVCDSFVHDVKLLKLKTYKFNFIWWFFWTSFLPAWKRFIIFVKNFHQLTCWISFFQPSIYCKFLTIKHFKFHSARPKFLPQKKIHRKKKEGKTPKRNFFSLFPFQKFLWFSIFYVNEIIKEFHTV